MIMNSIIIFIYTTLFFPTAKWNYCDDGCARACRMCTCVRACTRSVISFLQWSNKPASAYKLYNQFQCVTSSLEFRNIEHFRWSFRSNNYEHFSVRVHMWDLSGCAEYMDVRNELYNGSDAIFIVYDVTNATSFEALDSWLREANRFATGNPDIVIVGNKVRAGCERRRERRQRERSSRRRGEKGREKECFRAHVCACVVCLSVMRSSYIYPSPKTQGNSRRYKPHVVSLFVFIVCISCVHIFDTCNCKLN